MPYKLSHATKLAPPDLFPTPEAAIAQGREAFAIRDNEDRIVGHEEFILQEVREALLSDFFNVTFLVGDMREVAQERCGNSDVMDTFDTGTFNAVMSEAIDAFVTTQRLDLSGYTIVEASRVIHPGE